MINEPCSDGEEVSLQQAAEFAFGVPEWSSRKLDDNVFEIVTPMEENAHSVSRVYVFSDPHIDSDKSHRKLFLQHLDLAKSQDAPAIITGDLFDAMGARDDARILKGDLRDEYRVNGYWRSLIDSAVEMLSPYKGTIALISEGNHESSVREKKEVELVEDLVRELNVDNPKPIHYGFYAGTICYRFQSLNRWLDSIKHAYHHGSGFASLSKKIRRAAEHPDSTIHTFGHHHKCGMEVMVRNRVSIQGKNYQDKCYLLEVPGYKDEHNKGGREGWAVRKGHNIKPLGCWEIQFHWRWEDKKIALKPIYHDF